VSELPEIKVGRSSVEVVEPDCACPDGGLSPIRDSPTSDSNIVQITPNLYRDSISDHHELVFDPYGFSNIVVLNAAARVLLDFFVQPRDTNDAGEANREAIQQFIALGLLTIPSETRKPLRSKPRTLTAWLHVTNQCNLRCPYCYIHKTNQAMCDDIGRSAVEAVFRSVERHEFPSVKLKYAGGEATLNFRLIRTLHEHASQIAQRTGISLREEVLSNGVALNPDDLAYLRDARIKLMISLDGIGESHDAQRPLLNGQGSFARVHKNIERAIEIGVDPHLSITVTGRNADRLSETVEYALNQDLGFNLNFYRENDCSSSFKDLQASNKLIIDGMRAAFAVIESRLPQRRVIDGLVDHSSFGEPHEFACGAGHNYMVVNQKGQVAHCQMEIERAITDVHVEDPLTAIRNSNQFHNISVDEKEGCRDCTWKYWCAGGCSLMTYRATGRWDVKSPYCHVYQALFPDVVKLEGMRVLKWGA
jgi:uncharacterized protein